MASNNPGGVDTFGSPTMFDAIPFATAPLDFNLSIQPGGGVAIPKGGDILAPNPAPTAVSGDWDSLFSSGKVAADAALNSMRSIFNIFPDTQSPAATPAGPSTMERAGAGGGSVIANWSGILTQDAEDAVQKAGGFLSSTVNTVEQRVGAGIESTGTAIKDVASWAGSVLTAPLKGALSSLGISGSTVIFIGVGLLVLYLLLPVLTVRAARS